MRNQACRNISVLIRRVSVGLLLWGQLGLASAEDNEPAMESWGKDLFVEHCAACHGLDGTGEGPMSATLKKSPIDLTVLAKQNGGNFPRAKMLRFIDGERPIPSHGSREMPIWGKAFRREQSDTEARMRVFAVTSYIKLLQEQ